MEDGGGGGMMEPHENDLRIGEMWMYTYWMCICVRIVYVYVWGLSVHIYILVYAYTYCMYGNRNEGHVATPQTMLLLQIFERWPGATHTLVVTAEFQHSDSCVQLLP